MNEDLMRRIAQLESDIERLKTLEFISKGTKAIWGKWERTTDYNLASGTAQTVSWQNEYGDTDGMWSSGTNITINTAGVYIAIFQCWWNSNATGRRQAIIQKNGSDSSPGQQALPTVNGSAIILQASLMTSFAESDYITAVVRQTGGGTLGCIQMDIAVARLGAA